MKTNAIFPVDDEEFESVYAEEAAMVDASELIAIALEAKGVTRTEFAEILGVSKSEITARLAGERNITVRTLAATLHALGQRLELSMSNESIETDDRHRYERWRTPSHRDAHSSYDQGSPTIRHIRDWKPARRA